MTSQAIKSVSRFSLLAVNLLAVMALAGWVLDLPVLEKWIPDSSAMVPGTAIVFIVFSIALLLNKTERFHRRIVGNTLLITVLFYCGLTASEYVFHVRSPLMFWIFSRAGSSLRSSPETILCFTLNSVALWFSRNRRRRWPRFSQFLSLCSCGIALLSLMGHLTGAHALYSIFSGTHAFGMAFPAAIAFIFLTIAFLFQEPAQGLSSLLAADNAGGAVARKLLAASLIAPIAVEAVSFFVVDRGFIEQADRHALSMILLLTVFVAIIWTVATRLDWIDRQRQATQARLSRSEAELRSRQFQLDAFFDASPSGLALLDLNFRYLKVNEALAYIDGPSVAQHLGKTIEEVLPLVNFTKMPDFEEIVRTGKGVYNREISGETPRDPGKRRHWIASFFPIFGSDGKIALLGVAVIEVTAIKQAEEILRKRAHDMEIYAREVEDLYNNAPCGYHSIGPDGKFIQINDTELRWLGYARDEVLDKIKISCLMTEESRNRFEAHFPEFMRSGVLRDSKFDLVRKDGTILPALVNAVAIFDRSGKYLMSRSTVFDYSIQKKLEAELKDALRARDEFMSIAAHDLRMPLTSLTLQIHLLQKIVRESATIDSALAKHVVKGAVVSDDMLRLIDQARRQVDRFSALVNDLLDLTRIRVGKLSLELSEVDLVKAAQESVQSILAELQAKSIPIVLHGAVSLTGAWDRHRIDQILANLISNAVKYGGGRPIDIRIDQSADGKSAILRVKDQGNGLPKELHEKIFERFERGIEEQKIKGLGLGLYIVRQVVSAHHGRIWVESEPGHGSEFIVELPRNVEALKKAA
ncbi:MAG: ATP-binding protein [Oligoflexia bacterium]|nr:ATP-binding protein [Oligoflexia bacterium]